MNPQVCFYLKSCPSVIELWKYDQVNEENCYSSLLSAGEVAPGTLCPVWGHPDQKGCGETGEGYQDNLLQTIL